MNKKIRVLIIDDSAVVRQTIEQILSSDPQIEVIGSAADPYIQPENEEYNSDVPLMRDA
jgi:two-component system chemotaxis response regulator CheB